MVAEISEQTFMQEGDILITSKRITVGGNTFMVSNIHAVEVTKKSNRAYPIALLVLGLGAVSGGIAILDLGWIGWIVLAAGAISIAGALFLFTVSKTEYNVILTTDSGDVKLMSSLDRNFIDQVADAIEKVISLE